MEQRESFDGWLHGQGVVGQDEWSSLNPLIAGLWNGTVYQLWSSNLVE
jgi:hypothetical protein